MRILLKYCEAFLVYCSDFCVILKKTLLLIVKHLLAVNEPQALLLAGLEARNAF
jgi:hypothetical protein